jgi:hypothetical protein
MKHRELTGLVASSVALLLTLGFACVDADIPNVSNDLRDALAATYGNAGAPPVAAAGDGGSASTPSGGAGGDGGAAGDGDEPSDPPDENGGAAGSSMAGVAGSDGEGAAGGPPVTAGGCNGFEVLQQYCATSGCHGAPGGAFGDFASSEDAAREFIGVESNLSCAGQGAIVDTDDPSASLIVTKINGEADCGSPMPLTGEQLTDEEIACVEEWIAGF